MKQIIEIEVPEGKKAVWEGDKIVFKDIIPLLPKTWEEFCLTNPAKKGEAYINNSSNVKTLETQVVRLAATSRKYLPNKYAANQHLALMQLHQLRDCYRQGWTPNWTDCTDKNINYCITKVGSFLKVEVYYHLNCFLSFPTKDLAHQFLDNFRDLIEQAGDLI